MIKYYKAVIIGEQHDNLKHAMKEAKIIRIINPKYILFEGFVDYS